MEEQSESLPLPLTTRLKIFTTAAILLGNITFGCTFTSLSPALETLRSKYDASIDDISIIFTVMITLYCIGAIACGFISNYINRQLIVIGSLMGLAFSLYMIPHCPTKTVLFVIGGIQGFSSGLYDSSQIVWIIEIWQDKAVPFIQAQHFCFAIGSNIPPLILAPFLISHDDATSIFDEESRIYIPFTILGALDSVAFGFQVFLFIVYRYYTPPIYASENIQQTDDTSNMSSQITQIELDLEDVVSNNQQKSFNIIGISSRKLKLIAITGIFLGAYQGMEVSTMQFIPTFGQYSDLEMTESAAAYILTGLTGMFTVGRAIGIIIILKVRPELMICTNFFLITIGNFILLTWASDNITMFWAACIILGAGYSTMFPSFCAFIEKHLVFTNAVGSIIIVFGGTVSAIYPLIVGRILEENAVVLTYTNFFSMICCIIAMSWGYKLTSKTKIRER